MMKLLLLIICLLVSPLQIFSTPAYVIVIRHGEKPKDKDAKHLSAAGEERARRLVDFVKSNPELARIGAPCQARAAVAGPRPWRNRDGDRSSCRSPREIRAALR